MKYSAIQTSARLLRQEHAIEYVGSTTLLQLFKAAKWGSPTIDRNRMVLWDIRVLDACVDRLNRDGYDTLQAEADSLKGAITSNV